MTLRPDVRSWRLALWQLNLLVFGGLVAGVLLFFLWQIDSTRHSFEEHFDEHSELIGQVAANALINAEQTRHLVEQIVAAFLQRNAEFLATLEAIEPFSVAELTAYSVENGLVGIQIRRFGDSAVTGPPNWQPPESLLSSNGLHAVPDQHQYVLIAQQAALQVVVAIDATEIEQLLQRLSPAQVLLEMQALSGIDHMELSPLSSPAVAATAPLRQLPLGDQVLRLQLAEGSLQRRQQQLWRQFGLFAALLSLAGLSLSWLLYRSQQHQLQQVQTIERELGQRREDALIGRATATISHEIRNPLSALSLGLQRLQLECPQLGPEQHEMVQAMREAVARSNSILVALQRFARPLQPQWQNCDLTALIERLLLLYRPQIERQRLQLDSQLQPQSLLADEALMGQLVENLLKNALEAQPDGGIVRLQLSPVPSGVELLIENGGKSLDDAQVARMQEPYFTTKTRGSGLGLPLAGKIIAAHQGLLQLKPLRTGGLQVRVFLPRKDSGGGLTDCR